MESSGKKEIYNLITYIYSTNLKKSFLHPQFFTMSLGELQSSVESVSAWKAILWCFYPILALVTLELIARTFDDDDDQGGGKMIPALQRTQ